MATHSPATVITQVSVLLPSCVLTVTVAVPRAWAVTVPFDTEAILALLVVQDMALLSAFSGRIIAVSPPVSPTLSVIVGLSSVTLVT